jgi:TRAP-type C4-dicarboxylate transport system permease large subunit
VEVLAKELAPFLLTHIVVIFLLAYIPELTLFIPRLFGLLMPVGMF